MKDDFTYSYTPVCVYNQINLLFLVLKKSQTLLFPGPVAGIGMREFHCRWTPFSVPSCYCRYVTEELLICDPRSCKLPMQCWCTVSPAALKSTFPKIWCLEMSTAGKPPHLLPTKEQSALPLSRAFLCV